MIDETTKRTAMFNQMREGNMDRDSIRRMVWRRVSEYGGARDEWYENWFRPTLRQVEIDTVSWEQLIATMRENDSPTADSIEQFYEECDRFNS